MERSYEKDPIVYRSCRDKDMTASIPWSFLKSVAGYRVVFLFLWVCALTLIVQTNLTHALLTTKYAKTPTIIAEIDDEDYYLALIKERAAHPWRFGSPYFLEHTQAQYTSPQMGATLEGLFLRWTGTTLKTTSIIFDYATVFLLVLLFSLFLFRLTGSLLYTALGSVLLFLWPGYSSAWTRPVNPQISMILPLAYLLVAWPLVHTQTYRTRIVMGALMGIMVSFYPFHWTFVLPALMIFDAVQLYKNHEDWRLRGSTYLIFALVALPSFFYAASTRVLDTDPLVMERNGLLHSRLPTGIVYQGKNLVLLLFVYTVGKIKRFLGIEKERWMFLLTWLFSVFIVLNQPIITGVQFELSAHYKSMIFLTWVVSCMWALNMFMPRILGRRAWWPCAVIVFIAIFSIQVICEKNAVSPFQKAHIASNADENMVIDWLREQPHSVLSFPDELAYRIDLETNHKVLFSQLAWLYRLSQDELEDRFLYHDVENVFLNKKLLVENRFLFGFLDQARQQKRDAVVARVPWLGRWLPPVSFVVTDEKARAILRRRKELTALDLEKGLKKYHVNLVIYRQGEVLYERLPGAPVFTSGAYAIKRIQ